MRRWPTLRRRVHEVLMAEGFGGLLRRVLIRMRSSVPEATAQVDLPWLPLAPPRPRRDVRVDIVVPIYEAQAQVAECLESVLRHTDLSRHRLVLIDDASPSKEMAAFFSEFLAKSDGSGRNITLLRNDQNRGFVHSANRGLGASQNDALLLNSDTVVSAGWLDRMVAAAYSAPDIASVTPFSNDATICSVPRFCRPNRLPDGHDVDSFADLVSRLSPHRLPELPTGVGFCMYMRRAAIDRVGLFDEEHFGHGYGEENDWCMRAARIGLRHILEDSTFVFHHGSASFSPARREHRVGQALEQLDRLWPDYLPMVHRFIADNPLAGHHRILSWALQSPADEGKRRVAVLLAHAPDRRFGGVEHHVRDLGAGLHRRGWNCLWIYPEADHFTCRWDLEGSPRALRIPLCQDEATRRPEAAVDSIAYLLRALEADIFHVQHSHGLPLTITQGNAEAPPRVVSLHDFEFFCRRYNLLEKPGDVFCDYCQDEARCLRCLRWDAPETVPGTQRRRRREAESSLAEAAAVVAPSRYLADTFKRLYPSLARAHNLQVVPHGWPRSEDHRPFLNTWRRKARGLFSRRVRIAFLGTFQSAKGSRHFADLVKLLGERQRLEWWIVGGVADLDSLQRARDVARVNVHGPYDRSSILRILDRLKIDLVVLPSIWPEAYSYTLTEASLARRPVVAFDLGAIGERLKESGGSNLLVPPSSGVAGLSEAVKRFLDGGSSPAPVLPVPTCDEMVQTYVEIYTSALQGAPTLRTAEVESSSHRAARDQMP